MSKLLKQARSRQAQLPLGAPDRKTLEEVEEVIGAYLAGELADNFATRTDLHQFLVSEGAITAGRTSFFDYLRRQCPQRND